MTRNERRRQAAWHNGYNAGASGGSQEDCNEPRGTIFYDDWMDGFDIGFHEASNHRA